MGTETSKYCVYGGTREAAATLLMKETGTRHYHFVPSDTTVVTFNLSQEEKATTTWVTNVIHTDAYGIHYKMCVRCDATRSHYVAFYRALTDV